jgi:CheY-like chemotaxis protein
LAGGIAHGFNNILTAIQGHTDLAQIKISDDSLAINDLQQISNNVGRATDLTRQLTLFSHKQSPTLSAVNLGTTINNLKDPLDQMLGDKIEIKQSIQSDLWDILADKASVEYIIKNMVINAKEAMPQGGTLTLKCENVHIEQLMSNSVLEARTGQFVCLSISDTGIGMDMALQEHIFTPFFTTKIEEKRTGFGLSVVYRIVKNHKGWITIDSKPTFGATFHIYFPVFEDRYDTGVSKKRSAKGAKAKGDWILVVEDETLVRNFAVSGLKENGYRVLEADNAAEAIAIFEKKGEKIKALFCDIVLPDKNGLQLADYLLGRHPKLKILFSSGYAHQESHWEAIEGRGFQFLPKPYSLSTLIKAMDETLEGKTALK